MKSKEQISRQFRNHQATTNSGLSRQRDNDWKCEAFYAGNSMSYRDWIEIDAPKQRRIPVQFSVVQPYVEAVVGFMLQNRSKAKYIARVEGQLERDFYSKSANAIKDYTMANARANQIETVQNRHVLVRGYGATETEMTYGEGYATRDPNGEIIVDDVTRDIGWDPAARKPNLLDRKWDYYRKSYNIDDALKLFSDSEELDFEGDYDDMGPPYHFDPSNPPYDKSRITTDIQPPYEWDSKKDNTVWVYFYQWYEVEKFYRANNPLVNIDPALRGLSLARMQTIADEYNEEDSMFTFDPTAEELTFDSKIKGKLVEQFGDLIKPVSYNRKVFYKAVLSGKKVFKAFRSLSQQGFTTKFKTGKWDDFNKIWVGMVNSMMEPTEYYNKSLSELMFTIAANSKGGYMYEKGAIEKIREFERKVNKTDSSVEVAEGAISEGRIKEKKSPLATTGYENIIALAGQAIPDSVGLDPTFLGSSENKLETALLQRQRVRQFASTLAPYRDSEDAYLEEHARLLLDFMKVYAENNKGGLIRLLGEEGQQQFLRLSEDCFTAEYDIDIVEAPQTPEEKQEYAQIILGLADKYLSVGSPVASVLTMTGLKYLPLEAADKKMIMDALQPKQDPQVAALMQENQQLKSEQNRALVADLMASAQKKAADAQKAGADTAKSVAETQRIRTETQLAPLAELSKISVSV